MHKALFITLALFVSASLASCSPKKDEQAELQKAREMELASFSSDAKTAPPKPAPLPSNQTIDVPASVKAKYHKVTMGVGDLKTKEIKKFDVRIGESAPVPGTGYTLTVHSYLPTWAVRGKTVTSKSDKPDDPAVRATILEDGKQVFDGFIFQKHKTPSFITDKVAIGLLGAS